MCNAHNHSPGCNCGWGGGWHSNSYGGYGRTNYDISPRPTHITLTTKGDRLDSNIVNTASTPTQLSLNSAQLHSAWVSPNAKCPVCGCDVYFYQSEDGGRVFFDELGPPWPKHPCTDQSAQQAFSMSDIRPTPESERWDQAGWHSLQVEKTVRIGGRNLYQAWGRFNDTPLSFLFRIDIPVKIEVFLFKEKPFGTVELSFLARKEHPSEWIIGNGVASKNRFPSSSEIITTISFKDTEIGTYTPSLPREGLNNPC